VGNGVPFETRGVGKIMKEVHEQGRRRRVSVKGKATGGAVSCLVRRWVCQVDAWGVGVADTVHSGLWEAP